jgi:hypothetical protein
MEFSIMPPPARNMGEGRDDLNIPEFAFLNLANGQNYLEMEFLYSSSNHNSNDNLSNRNDTMNDNNNDTHNNINASPYLTGNFDSNNLAMHSLTESFAVVKSTGSNHSNHSNTNTYNNINININSNSSSSSSNNSMKDGKTNSPNLTAGNTKYLRKTLEPSIAKRRASLVKTIADDAVAAAANLNEELHNNNNNNSNSNSNSNNNSSNNSNNNNNNNNNNSNGTFADNIALLPNSVAFSSNMESMGNLLFSNNFVNINDSSSHNMSQQIQLQPPTSPNMMQQLLMQHDNAMYRSRESSLSSLPSPQNSPVFDMSNNNNNSSGSSSNNLLLRRGSSGSKLIDGKTALLVAKSKKKKDLIYIPYSPKGSPVPQSGGGDSPNTMRRGTAKSPIEWVIRDETALHIKNGRADALFNGNEKRRSSLPNSTKPSGLHGDDDDDDI